MSSVRLNGAMRQAICQDILRHRFGEEIDLMVELQANLARRVYQDVYSNAVREKMNELPAGWLPEVAAIKVQFGDQYRYAELTFSGSTDMHHRVFIHHRKAKNWETVALRVPSKDNGRCVKVYDQGHKLAKEAAELFEQRGSLGKQIEQAEREVRAALNASTTASALINAWPEVEMFVKRHLPVPAKVPAPQFDQLNERLGLPPEDEREAA